jgi:DNA polymerase-3 subunit epsilon
MKTKEQLINDKDEAIKLASWILLNEYCVIDTETTGITNAEMVQIAILHSNGYQYKSMVKPSKPIEPKASEVHHITDADVERSPSALQIVKSIPVRGLIIIYNAPFDTEVIKNSVAAQGGTYNFEAGIYDAMLIYSAFKGEWNDYRNNYKWHKLGDACRQAGLTIDEELHDAMADSIMTERLIKWVAQQKLSTE